MSDWRSQVSNVEWRYVNHAERSRHRFALEAMIEGRWWPMGGLHAGCGESIAREIVWTHNARLRQPETAGGLGIRFPDPA